MTKRREMMIVSRWPVNGIMIRSTWVHNRFLLEYVSLVFVSIFSCMCMLCRLLFVLLSFYFYFWPLCCLSFIDLRILFVPLVSSNSSCTSVSIGEYFTLTFGFVINEIWLCYTLKCLVICWHPTLIPLYVLNTYI